MSYDKIQKEIDPTLIPIWGSWLYNVPDEYKSLSKEEIKEKVKEKALPFAVTMSQIVGDFNFGSVIRSANGLGAKEVFYYGKRKYDRRGACGTYHYSDVHYLSSIELLKELKNQYVFVGLENNLARGSSNIRDFIWPKNSMILLGEESCGLSEEVLDLCDYLVEIPLFGSVRSFNVASAASIAMYDYYAKYAK